MKCYQHLSLFLITIFISYSFCIKLSSDNCLIYKENLCAKCNKGFYNLNGICYEICPIDFIADNYSMTCSTSSTLDSSFIKAYTISRCINQCGVEFSDCSCDLSCKRRGNCCSDFKLCEMIQDNYNTNPKTIKNCKFDTSDHKICLQCEEGHFYYNNMCVMECQNKIL
jgi:hypothetical protein